MTISPYGAREMKNKSILIIVFSIFCILGFWSELMSDAGNLQDWDKKDIEKYLKTAEIVSLKIDPQGGRTEAWIISLDDGKAASRGLFKHVDSARPTPIADSYRYEISAYELDKLLDFNRIPPVVEREIEGTNGSLQLYIEGCKPLSYQMQRNIQPPDPAGFQDALAEINVFENLSYCKHDLNDVLIHTNTWKACRVDFSQAFSPTPKLIPDQSIERCSRKLYENLVYLSEEVLQDKLKHWLNSEEISALLERKKIIIDTIKRRVEEWGEEAVLF
jgi:hypothetical protein